MALIKTVEEFRKHVSVNKGTSLNPVLSDILLVERDIIKKHLGLEFYTELDGKYNAGTLEPQLKVLVDLIQFALANLAMASYMALNQVQVGDGGITKSEKTAYRYQVRDLKLNLITKGYNGLESVLEYLESKINDPLFAKWATSSAVVVFRKFFINSASEFNEEYNINGSRLTYLSLQSIIKKVEDHMLEPVLGAAFYDELKLQIREANVNAENKLLLQKFIRPAVAHYTAAKAIAERSFKFSGDSITLNLEELMDDTSKAASADNDKLLLKKIEQAYSDAGTYIHKLIEHLNKNASAEKYKAYFESELYKPANPTPEVFKNTTGAKFFAWM